MVLTIFCVVTKKYCYDNEMCTEAFKICSHSGELQNYENLHSFVFLPEKYNLISLKLVES